MDDPPCASCRFWNPDLAETNWNCRLGNLPADEDDGCGEHLAADAPAPHQVGMGSGQGEERPCLPR